MLKKTITYTDFNDEEVSEDFFFHLSKVEIVDLEVSHQGGLEAAMRRIIAAEDNQALFNEFKTIVLNSYGQRSADGKRFIKNQALREEFESTKAYETLVMELISDAEKAAEFVRGIVPQDLAEEAAKVVASAPALIETPAEPTPEAVETVTNFQLQQMDAETFRTTLDRMKRGEVALVD